MFGECVNLLSIGRLLHQASRNQLRKTLQIQPIDELHPSYLQPIYKKSESQQTQTTKS